MKNEKIAKMTVGQVTLNFDLVPTKYFIEKKFNHRVDACLGQNHPLVSFESGSVQTLTLSILMDEDVNESIDLSEAQKFMKELEKVDPKTRSVGKVSVELGPLHFKGYVAEYRYSPIRFKSNMIPSSLRMDLVLISAGGIDEASSS
jgi:hypothetical protein